MTDAHVDELLVDHLRGDLEGPERARVDAHLAACAECRASREGFARIVAALADTAPPAPPIHWGAYRAELRERIERAGAGRGGRWAWLARPVPALVAVSGAGAPGSRCSPDASASSTTAVSPRTA